MNNELNNLVAVVMMAGKSTRMNSDLSKVVQPLEGKELGRWILDACVEAGVKNFRLVVGHEHEMVEKTFSGYPTVLQTEQKGTGHAVGVALEGLESHFANVLVLSGDTPLITKDLLRKLIDTHRESDAACTMLTCSLDDPTGYGRVFCDENGQVREMVEHKDATEEQRAHKEINTAFYIFNRQALETWIKEIEPSPVTGEIYLTAIFGLFFANGLKTVAVHVDDFSQLLGVNTPEELETAKKILRERS